MFLAGGAAFQSSNTTSKSAVVRLQARILAHLFGVVKRPHPHLEVQDACRFDGNPAYLASFRSTIAQPGSVRNGT